MKLKSAEDWHLFLCVGSELDREDFNDIPGNVSILKWAPQLELLNASSLTITHGGLGTIKACIFYGVPMIVLPLGRDQDDNAKRVECHNLGIGKDFRNLSAEDLESLILHVLNDHSIKESVREMQTIFREKEESQVGIKLIEEIIRSKRKFVL